MLVDNRQGVLVVERKKTPERGEISRFWRLALCVLLPGLHD